ncbi:MAG TPA: acyl-phosphate glycerol 3-phosphate acyltransferase, partial [Caldithrix sp.]|nr:acyl-phosphate glycerol 3-phosphate acyltransferase [Caldithrix sp.]
MVDALIILVLSYIIGSIPTAIIAGKWLKKIDIREYGSGNAGATNVFRTLGWKAGITVLLIDMFKGFVPVYWLA